MNYLVNSLLLIYMKRLNNKGYMLVEVIIASVLAMIIAWFLIDITVKMVNKNNDYYVDSVLLADKAVITKEIMDDINNPDLKLTKVNQSVGNDHEITLTFKDSFGNNNEKKILIDKNERTITYHDYKRTLNEKLNLEIVKVEHDYSNKILKIDIPAYTNYSQINYGVKLIINYSEDTSIDIPQHSSSVVTYCKNGTETGTGIPEVKIAGVSMNVKTGSPNFSKTATTDEGIYMAADDLGNSCYFRGAATKNYVKFGKNSSNQDMYWRIIRVNGDGTVRMIYDGTTLNANGIEPLDNKSIGDSSFSSNRFDNAYVGFVHGIIHEDNYATTHNNLIDSKIKKELDKWYENNFKDSEDEEYIADGFFCNDRSLSSGEGFYEKLTFYGGDNRLNTKKSPILKCVQKKDRFTTDGDNFEIDTNGKLKYPIGLITADEVSMAGGVFRPIEEGINSKYINKNYYLYSGGEFLTMTPISYIDADSVDILGAHGANVFSVWSNGELYVSFTDDECAIRPVINLKSDALKYGLGTLDNPFRVSFG